MGTRFTIVVPTRERVKSIHRLVKSIQDTANDPASIEMIFRADNDDNRSIDVIRKLDCDMGVRLTIGKRDALSDLWDQCYPKASANRIMMCADDAVFRTKDWDDKIAAVTPLPYKNVYFAWCNDKYQGNWLATLPIVSRKWIDICGYFVPRGYKRDYCDTHLHDIANRVRKHKQRHFMKYFKDIIVEHMHPAAGKANYDNTYQYRLKLPDGAKLFNKRAREREEIARRIAKYMEKNQKLK